MATATTRDFATLAGVLLSQSQELVSEWLPGGERKGREWICGNLKGDTKTNGGSCRVNLDTGMWQDFATEDRGGDLISLYAKINGCKNSDAYDKLAGAAGYIAASTVVNEGPLKKVPKLIAAPQGTEPPAPPGNPSNIYPYCDRRGTPIMYVVKYIIKDEKIFVTYSWSADDREWTKKAWPNKRPLFGLNELHRKDRGVVMVCEGEKATLAAAELFPHLVCMCWTGGSKAVGKTDWSPLEGRDVILWPDADQPGIDAMDQVTAKLRAVAVSSLRRILPAGKPKGWDAADATLDDAITLVDESRDVDVDGDIRSSDDVRAAAGVIIDPQTYKPMKNLHCIGNVMRTVPELRDSIWYDDFHSKIFTTWRGKQREWCDADTFAVTEYFQGHLQIDVRDDNVRKAVHLHASRNRRNEPNEWLQGLKWDGINRIDMMMADAFGVEQTIYSMAVSKNFMLSLAARISKPGCKVDSMVVFEGAQGTFKSTAMSIIGGDWYTEMIESINTKDFFLALHGKLIVEIAELDAFNKGETTRIKQTISNACDRYRKPFDRETQDHPRRCIFVGTTNETHYLKDSSGGRRFWPISCGRINLDLLKENRDQYFAEACQRINSGASWWDMPVGDAAEEQEARREEDTWEEAIKNWLYASTGEITTKQILLDAVGLDVDKQDRRSSNRACAIMRMMGYENKVSKSVDGRKSARTWTPK